MSDLSTSKFDLMTIKSSILRASSFVLLYEKICSADEKDLSDALDDAGIQIIFRNTSYKYGNSFFSRFPILNYIHRW